MRPSAMGGSLGSWRIALAVLALAVLGAAPDDAPSQIRVARDGEEVDVRWPIQDGEWGTLTVDLRPGRPTIARMGIAADASGESRTIASDLDPVTFVTVGSREAPPGRPPEMSPFNTFFDSPAKRPHRSYKARLDLKDVRVTNEDHRAMVALGGLQAGPFSGELQITVYAGSRLIHVQAVLSTSEDRTAFLYDAGLASDSPAGRALAWIDAEGRPQRKEFVPDSADTPVAVRHRAIALETEGGSVACFPPPHQFFFPRDLTDNQSTVWFGRGHRGLESRPGFGVRQTETGGGAYVPWFNAPPGTEQRLGVFYLLSRGPADEALREALRYTRGDRFADLPGHVTLSSHWHMAIAVAAMQEAASGRGRTVPDFVRMFKDMNVDAVHLAEFHGDGHPQDPGPLRLPELEAMFAECRRLSDDELLLLPGEEANVHLGLPAPGRHPGHWLYLFPGPVAWIMRRAEGEPFVEDHPRLGKLYRVGDRHEMLRLLELERGLAWAAHARIKASSWAPDVYRREDFYLSDRWLGAAWKAMPADLSRDRLGERGLDLLDDMANWGRKKAMLGEVDVFKIDRTHELYGHMNVNYLRLDRAPRYEDDWSPILDALRSGRFFVTTGEVLIRDFRVGGRASGEVLEDPGDATDVEVELEWTFPLRFAELVSGDGERVFRERVDLSDTRPFGRRILKLRPDLRGRRWARVEGWDVAADGAFSQPVWLGPGW